MRLRLATVISLILAIASLIHLAAHAEDIRASSRLLGLAFSIAAIASSFSISWFSLMLSLTSITIVLVETSSLISLAILVYGVVVLVFLNEPFINTRESKHVVPAMLFALIGAALASLFSAEIVHTGIKEIAVFGSSSAGLVLIYLYFMLLTIYLIGCYYSSERILPRITKNIYHVISPSYGFKLALYGASFAPSIVFKDPLYAVATLVAILMKTLIPIPSRLRFMDVIVYSVSYAFVIVLLGYR
jgi:hypothetical protein